MPIPSARIAVLTFYRENEAIEASAGSATANSLGTRFAFSLFAGVFMNTLGISKVIQ
jgi:hypothetical protein